MNWQLIKPSHRHQFLVELSSPIKLTEIRDEIAAEMRSQPCYHRDSWLCEYLIKALAITQPGDGPAFAILTCPLKDSRGGHSMGCGGHSLPGHARSAIVV